jgi:hypothetical protein
MAAPVYDKVGACEYGREHDDAVMTVCTHCTHELPQAKNDSNSVAWSFEDYSSSHKKCGGVVLLSPDEFLGHVRLLSNTATYLAEKLQDDVARIESRFRALAGLGSPTNQKAARQWFQRELVNRPKTNGGPLPIAGPVCWLFRSNNNETPNDLLSGHNAIELPCRLGLPVFLQEEKICPPFEFLGFVAKGSTVSRRPTVFDGDYVSVRELWQPNGFTRPIEWAPSSVVAKGGMPEIVADAPLYDTIDANIFVFQSFSFSK